MEGRKKGREGKVKGPERKPLLTSLHEDQIQSPESNEQVNCEIKAEFSFLLQWKLSYQTFSHFSCSLFSSASWLHHAWSRRWSQGTCQRQGPLFKDKEIQVVTPLADPGWAPCQESTPRSPGVHWAWLSCWELSRILSPWTARFYSEYGQEGKNSKYSQLSETFCHLSAYLFFSLMTYFSIFNCFVYMVAFLRKVSKYHFGESFVFRTLTVSQSSHAKHERLDLAPSCCFPPV